MVHQLLYHRAGHVLHDVTVDHSGDDGDGDDLATLLDDGPDFFIFNPHDVLPIDLQEVVIDEETISGSRGIHSYGSDLSFLELESNVSSRILKYHKRVYLRFTKICNTFISNKAPSYDEIRP